MMLPSYLLNDHFLRYLSSTEEGERRTLAEMVMLKGDITLTKSEVSQLYTRKYTPIGKAHNAEGGILRTSHLVNFAFYLVKPFLQGITTEL